MNETKKQNVASMIFNKVVEFIKSDFACKRKLKEAEAKVRLLESQITDSEIRNETYKELANEREKNRL